MNSDELAGKLGPVVGAERISAIDSLRGVAVLGILLMNIADFGLPYAYTDPSIYGGDDGANLAVWFVNALLFEGTMRGLFSMLFGAGVILLTSRAEARGRGLDVADIYYRRTIWLIVFGLVHSWVLLWHAEILYWYGIVGLVLFPFRKTKPARLVVFSLLAMLWLFAQSLATLNGAMRVQEQAAQVQAIAASGGALTDEQQGILDNWQSIVEGVKASPETVAAEIEAARGGYFTVRELFSERIAMMQTTVLYEGAFFDVICMMFLGMALMQWNVLSARRSTKFYLTVLLLGYGIGLSVNAYEASALIDNQFSVIAQRQWGFQAPLYNVARVPMTLGHMALVMLVFRLGLCARLMSALAAVGRMALTNYVMHSIICAFVFYGFGFGLYGRLARYELYYVVLGIWVFQLLASPIWLRHFRFGPLEWLWRSLTYWERQPFRRAPGSPEVSSGSA